MTTARWRELFAFTARLGLAPEVKLRDGVRPLAGRIRVRVEGASLVIGDRVAPLDGLEWVRIPLFVVGRRDGRLRDRSLELESLLAAAGIPYEREVAAVMVRAGGGVRSGGRVVRRARPAAREG